MEEFSNALAREEDKISRINSAGLINIRMNELWHTCDIASAQGLLQKWNAYLDAIWRNLACDAKKEFVVEYEKIEDKLLRSGFFNLYHSSPGFNKVNPLEYKMRRVHYRLLHDKHVLLQEVWNRQGKGNAYKDEFEDDFE